MNMAVIQMPGRNGQNETGMITKWHKKTGDWIAEGDELFSFDTDDGSYTVKSQRAGRLVAIFVPEGELVHCPADVGMLASPAPDSALRVGQMQFLNPDVPAIVPQFDEIVKGEEEPARTPPPRRNPPKPQRKRAPHPKRKHPKKMPQRSKKSPRPPQQRKRKPLPGKSPQRRRPKRRKKLRRKNPPRKRLPQNPTRTKPNLPQMRKTPTKPNPLPKRKAPKKRRKPTIPTTGCPPARKSCSTSSPRRTPMRWTRPKRWSCRR